MKLTILQETMVLDKISGEEIIKYINNYLPKDYYVSYLIIDGEEVHEDYQTYLYGCNREIEEIEVVVKTVENIVNDLLLSTEEYTQRALPELVPLSGEFYSNPKSSTWSTLDQLLSGLQWMNDMLMSIGRSGHTPSNWDQYMEIYEKIQVDIKELSDAIENEDGVLIGDIIQYEFISNFKELQKVIQSTIDTEGIRHDLN